ncbi:beta-galactosidase [Paenibacillus sp. TRM 82003]|nr:beta-galactosidase [Paenibacillus sp. TRM 82003]
MRQQQMWYGGDYNPDQWPEDVWQDDMRLMNLAGVNMASVAIFSWARLQPSETTYDFEWLDKLMDLMHERGVKADLATATASPPAWMAKNYPDSLAVDENGVPYGFGSRQHYNPNSPVYRKFAAALVTKLAERYKDHPALAMWHINNEYACHVQEDYSEITERKFREWLKARYGTLEELNERWGTAFWSQRYYEWDEVPLPKHTPTIPNPGQSLDYKRFMDDCILELYLMEKEILRAATPNVPIMTNFMGFFKPLDYWKWAPHQDVVTWDSYPDPHLGTPVAAAMAHDLMRSLRGGQPFLLMEQVTGQVNWRPRNALKRPGVMRLWSYQTVAHGGDGILFFQWRQSRAGAEKWHSAMVTHTGDEHSRIYREVEQLGNELKKLDAVVGSRTKAEAAIVFDWENWWALELPSKPSEDVKYVEQIEHVYRALYNANIGVDFVKPTDDLSGYKFVAAPALYMVTAEAAANLETYAKNGGTLLVTFFSGLVDENDRVHLGGYPAPLRSVLGLTVEEFDAMAAGEKNAIASTGAKDWLSGEFDATLWADVIRAESATPLATFGGDFYAGRPAVTVNAFGAGRAYYVGTFPEQAFMEKLLRGIADEAGLKAAMDVPHGVETTTREGEQGTFTFLLNHLGAPTEVALPAEGAYVDLLTGASYAAGGVVPLDVNGVAILKHE